MATVGTLPRAVAINYAKLLAYKDEYEVARLFTDGRFEKQLRDQFDGDFKFSFDLAPPFLSRSVDAAKRPTEAGLRFVDDDGVPDPHSQDAPACTAWRFDIFGQTDDRKLERDLIAGYEKDVATVLGLLSPSPAHDTSVEILSLPDRITPSVIKRKVGATSY